MGGGGSSSAGLRGGRGAISRNNAIISQARAQLRAGASGRTAAGLRRTISNAQARNASIRGSR